MTTVAIFPVPTPDGPTAFCAVAGQRQSSGATAGQALDALNAQLPAADLNTVVILQHLRPDALFNEQQQRRLGELMNKWRSARDRDEELPSNEAAELQSLIDTEFRAAGERAARVAQQQGS